MLSSELRIELEGHVLRHSAAFGTGADGPVLAQCRLLLLLPDTQTHTALTGPDFTMGQAGLELPLPLFFLFWFGSLGPPFCPHAHVQWKEFMLK